MDVKAAIATELFKEGIQTIPEQDIKIFFESIIAVKTTKLNGTQDTRALTDLNANVMLINELRNVFLSIRKER